MATSRRWIGLASSLALAAGAIPAAAMTADERRAAGAMFERFETVSYLHASLVDATLPKGTPELRGIVRIPAALAIFALEAAAEGTAAKVAAASDGIVVGARDFRAPTGPSGLGAVRQKTTAVFVIRPGRRPDLAGLERYRSSEAAAQRWSWPTPPQEGDPEAITVHAAFAGPSYLVLANDLDDLRAVKRDLERRGARAAAPRDVHDWEGLSRRGVWTYRRYRHEDVADRVAAAMDVVGRDARALVLLPDLERRSLRLRLVATPVGSTASEINARAPLPPLVPVAPGVWESAFPYEQDEASVERMFVAYGLLGYGLYL